MPSARAVLRDEIVADRHNRGTARCLRGRLAEGQDHIRALARDRLGEGWKALELALCETNVDPYVFAANNAMPRGASRARAGGPGWSAPA